jgi:hypothetical protein
VPLGGRHWLLLFLFGGRYGLLAADPGRGEGGQHRRGLRRIYDAELEPVWRRRRGDGGGSGVQEVGVRVEEAPVATEWVEGAREEVAVEWVVGARRETRGWRRRRWWWLSWGMSTVFPENEGAQGCYRNMQRLLRSPLEHEQCTCLPHFEVEGRDPPPAGDSLRDACSIILR